MINEVIDGEAIILHLGTGRYYSARGCGAQVWGWLSSGVASRDVGAVLTATYDVTADVIQGAVAEFTTYLLSEGLLVELPADDASPAAAIASSTSGAAGKSAFDPPSMESFSDLEDLLLLDPVHEVNTELGWPHAAVSDS